jgi:hypothetical protein
VRSPEIPAGEALTFEQRVEALGAAERPLAASCTR